MDFSHFSVVEMLFLLHRFTSPVSLQLFTALGLRTSSAFHGSHGMLGPCGFSAPLERNKKMHTCSWGREMSGQTSMFRV